MDASGQRLLRAQPPFPVTNRNDRGEHCANAQGRNPQRLRQNHQALRIIIPPTTNQYLNLAKNTSLAIAIGFPDLFNVSRTISNQTGQVVQMIGLIMVSYLTISLTTSLLMNLYNRRVRLVER